MLNDIDRWENEGGRPAPQSTTIAAAAATRPPVRERPREAASRIAVGHLLNGSRYHDERFVTTLPFGGEGRPYTRTRP